MGTTWQVWWRRLLAVAFAGFVAALSVGVVSFVCLSLLAGYGP